jgi:hypothetical protein
MDARLPRTPRIPAVLALRFPRTVVIGAAVAAVLAGSRRRASSSASATPT